MDAKTCCSCLEDKPASEFFHKLGKYRHGLSGSCKKCTIESMKQSRDSNRNRFHETRRRGRQNKLRQIHELKSVPCMDCGNRYPPYVMDFDHRDSENKVANVSTLLNIQASMQRIMEEIEKCDIVCANCHRVRTFNKKHKGDKSDSPEYGTRVRDIQSNNRKKLRFRMKVG